MALSIPGAKGRPSAPSTETITPLTFALYPQEHHMDINQLTNLRLAFEELERRVQRALNTQVGDDQRLVQVQNEVLLYSQAVEQVCRICLTQQKIQ